MRSENSNLNHMDKPGHRNIFVRQLFMSEGQFCCSSQSWQKNKASIMCSSMCHPDVSTSARADLHVSGGGGILEFIKHPSQESTQTKLRKRFTRTQAALAAVHLYHRMYVFLLCESLGKETLFNIFYRPRPFLPRCGLSFPTEKVTFSNGLN